ncbi:MAG TPA: metallophosphoesterase [Solirubrobacterales bacterium]
MRTAIVSDLHLGSATGEDILRDADIRRILLEELAAADRLVLLGDVLELREVPLASALEAARPFFEQLGETMAGKSVLLIPGNHDHRLAEPLLERLALRGRSLDLEQNATPDSEPAARIAAWLSSAELKLAYPGAWLRDDVYATHGHYMDCHMSLPRLECIAAAASMRALGALPESTTPANYERVLRPVYDLSFGLAQGGASERAHRPSERAWRAISSANGRRGRLRRAALRAAIPAGIWSLNRLLRAEFEPTLTSSSISHSGIAAARNLVARLNLDAAHVITGHTHRGGPWTGDPAWELASGGRLHNTGSWVFASVFHGPGTPPGSYWPGTITWLEDSGPPQHSRLLMEHSRDELRGTVRRLAATTI